MTLAKLWALFCSLPLVVQAWIVFALLLLGVGVWTASRCAGRVVAWADERRERRAAAVDPFVRVLGLAPEAVRREFQAIVDASADDTEAAR